MGFAMATQLHRKKTCLGLTGFGKASSHAWQQATVWQAYALNMLCTCLAGADVTWTACTLLVVVMTAMQV
jgi:hypothetical protein